MVQSVFIAKEMKGVSKIAFTLFLVIFPFGVLLTSAFRLNLIEVRIQPVDIAAFFSIFPFLFNYDFRRKISIILGPLLLIQLIAIAIYFYNYQLSANILIGSLYFLRLLVYLILPLAVSKLYSRKSDKIRLQYILFLLTFIVSLIGFYQYINFPDLRSLKFWGWDDHLDRLVSSFLDPAFTGLILVFGILTGVHLYLKDKRKILILLLIPIFLSLLLTYSRASYLSLLSGMVYLLYKKGKIRLLFAGTLLTLLIFPFLPYGSGYGVNLLRTHSIVAKAENLNIGFQIFNDNPVFGVGYNNICWEKLRFGDYGSQIHSCFGLDSSLLLILTSFGVVGFFVLVNLIIHYKKLLHTKSNSYILLVSVLLALFVHALFTNSFFYPWIMAYVGILYSLNLKKD